MKMLTAIKPIWAGNRFTMQVVNDADVSLAYDGWLLFEDAAYAAEGIKTGKLIQSWSDRKRAFILEWLASQIGK
jgi:hypothetical protein